NIPLCIDLRHVSLMIRPPPPLTLFPYTTLFRSAEINLERLEDVVQCHALLLGLDAVHVHVQLRLVGAEAAEQADQPRLAVALGGDRKSTRLNSSHSQISYAVFCLKKKTEHNKLL